MKGEFFRVANDAGLKGTLYQLSDASGSFRMTAFSPEQAVGKSIVNLTPVGTTLSNHGQVFTESTIPGNANPPLGTVAADGSYFVLIDDTAETRLARAGFNGAVPFLTQVKTFGAASSFKNLIPYSTTDVAFIEDNSASNTSAVWRSNGFDRGTFALLSNFATNISSLAQFGSTLASSARPGDAPGANTVVVSQGQPTTTGALADVGTVTSNVTVSVVNEDGDGVITGRDMTVSSSTLGPMSLTTAPGTQELRFNVTALVRFALENGQRRVTLRLNVASPQVLLDLAQPNPLGAIPTGLAVTRPHGVRADLLDVNGGVLEEGITAFDMRNLEAGTYYLRVFNPNAAEQTAPLSFAIEVRPPIQGQAHSLTDNDFIEGGEGEDILVGSGQLDRIFGESGVDTFLAEPVEVRDLAPGEVVRRVDAADALLSSKAKDLDPEIAFPDVVLRREIARALNVPLIGTQFAIPVRATDLAKLTSFSFDGSAGGGKISNLSGLEYATNLVSLDLANNVIYSLAGLDPGADEAGAQVGLGLLRQLRLDGNPIRDLASLGELTQLRVLSINDTANFSTASSDLIRERFAVSDTTVFPDFAALMNPNLDSEPNINITNNSDAANQNVAVRYTGQLFADRGGQYTFRLLSNNKSRLYIDGRPVTQVNQPQNATSATTVNITLDPGVHSLTVEYLNGVGASNIRLEYTQPGENSFVVIGSDVLSIGGLSDISQLASLQNLRYLSLANNSINDVGPIAAMRNILTGETTLETLDLSGNDIRDVGPLSGTFLIDDGQFGQGYSETGLAKWTRNENEVLLTGYRGDYRRQIVSGSNSAVWTFNNLDAATYDIFTSWHAADGQASNAGYAVTGATSSTVVVNQRFAPTNDLPLPLGSGTATNFQLLGQFIPAESISPINGELSNKFTVTLSSVAANGTLTADAVVLRASELPQSGLKRLNLKHNPLNETAFEFSLPTLSTRNLSLIPNVTLLTDANRKPVALTPPGPQFGSAGNVYEFPSLIDTAFGLSDSGSDWLVVGAGDSSEVLRFNGNTDNSRGAFAEVVTQLKSATGTQPVLTGGDFGLNNDLYVVDSATDRVVKIDTANGNLLAANSTNVLNGRDLAFSGSSVFVADAATGRLIKLNGDTLALENANFATLPVGTFGGAEYGIESRPGVLGDDLFVAYGRALISFNPLTLTPTGGVRRIDEVTGATVSEFIPESDVNLTFPLDITIDSAGKVFVVDRSADGATYRVLRYSSAGTFETQLIAPRAMNTARLDQRPRIKISPDGSLFVSDPLTGAITRHNRTTGAVLDNPYAAAGGTGGLDYASFLAFAQPEFTYDITTNNTAITGRVFSGTPEILIPIPVGTTGTMQVTVNVFDGPHAAQDFRGRSTEFTFDLTVGRGAIYGNVYDDLNFNNGRDLTDPGLENITVFWDLNDNGVFNTGEPTSRTDAAGNYALTNLTFGSHNVRATLNPSLTSTFASPLVAVSAGTPIVENINLAVVREINAGPDQLVPEGDPTFTVAVRRTEVVQLINDVNPAGSSGAAEYTEFNGKLYFSAFRADTGTELFVYDGTSVALAADVLSGVAESFPTDLAVYNGALYFNGATASGSRQLYRYNGVNPPTLITINAAASANPADLTVFNGSLYFSANASGDTRTQNRELFFYNGTSLSMVAEINPTGSANPQSLTVFGGQLYFSAFVTGTGTELYRHNGSVTTLALDLVLRHDRFVPDGTDGLRLEPLLRGNDRDAGHGTHQVQRHDRHGHRHRSRSREQQSDEPHGRSEQSLLCRHFIRRHSERRDRAVSP